MEQGVKYEPRKTLQSAVIGAWDAEDPRLKLFSANTERQEQHQSAFGKTFNTSLPLENLTQSSSILPISKVLEALPDAKGKKKKKKKKKDDDDDPLSQDGEGSPKKKKKKGKKKKGKKDDLPPEAVWLPVGNQTVEEQLGKSVCWSTVSQILHKKSDGFLSTESFAQKSAAFQRLNPNSAHSNILPVDNFLGKKPDPDDPFTRRKVKQLNDIDLLEDQEPEEVANYKRMPAKVLYPFYRLI